MRAFGWQCSVTSGLTTFAKHMTVSNHRQWQSTTLWGKPRSCASSWHRYTVLRQMYELLHRSHFAADHPISASKATLQINRPTGWSRNRPGEGVTTVPSSRNSIICGSMEHVRENGALVRPRPSSVPLYSLTAKPQLLLLLHTMGEPNQCLLTRTSKD
jgi:hypothetical protein